MIYINEIDTFEESLGVAIGAWIEENVKNMIGKPILDIRSYAYLPIVVIKNTASPKLGILQVKGTMAMTIEDGNGGKITEVKNFKYQCKFKFHSGGSVNSDSSGDDGDLYE